MSVQDLPLIKSMEVKLKSIDGDEKTFRISRVPAVKGREIFTQYVPTAMPKIGDYKSNEKLMRMLMCYVDVKVVTEDKQTMWIRLDNDTTLNGHITDWEMLAQIEFEMVKYNTNFFSPEKLSGVLSKFNRKLPDLITSMLSRLSGQLSAKNKQR